MLATRDDIGQDEPVIYRPTWWRPFYIEFTVECDCDCKEPQVIVREQLGLRQTIAMALVAAASAVCGAILTVILRG